MPSPFPGMDPYLEDPAYWQDFHRSFITYCRDALLDQLPDRYDARIDEQIRLVEHGSDSTQAVLPDIDVTIDTGRVSAPASRAIASAIATIEPVAIPMPTEFEELRDVWIEIRHRPDRALVTAIEVLSPSNKTGAGYWDYRAKRRSVLDRHAHLVEIDLLIGGKRQELRDPLPPGDYYAFVTRENRKPLVVDVYPWHVRDPLPTIPIPLKPGDPDIGLSLAEVFATTYERSRYRRILDYAASPPPPLAPADLKWACEWVASAR